MKSARDNNGKTLKGRTLYIHPMTQAGARLLAAVFRSLGVDAETLPRSDTRTLELGGMYSSGEECFPEKITIGDYLKVTEQPGFDPSRTAFLMPAANGPCRFGQYTHYLQHILEKNGLDEVLVMSPSSSVGYGDIGGTEFYRSTWIALVASDILRKMLLRTRPYEKNSGTTDAVYEKALCSAERVLEKRSMKHGDRVDELRDSLVKSRDDFRSIDTRYVKGRPLLAVIGEIFCRHNRFANEDMIRKLEDHGAETWIADVGEWVFYTDWSRGDELVRMGRRFSLDMGVVKLKERFMKHDEHILLAPFADDFIGIEEPASTAELLSYGERYLPARGARGEMAMSIARAGYCHAKGVDGIVDISPFSCMNGIVTEAVYPSFSRDHDLIPCRVFYYDGSNLDIDRDLGIFMELVRGYMSRKIRKRVYGTMFTG